MEAVATNDCPTLVLARSHAPLMLFFAIAKVCTCASFLVGVNTRSPFITNWSENGEGVVSHWNRVHKCTDSKSKLPEMWVDTFNICL